MKKHHYELAIQEITRLNRQNELLQTQVGVIDVFRAALLGRPEMPKCEQFEALYFLRQGLGEILEEEHRASVEKSRVGASPFRHPHEKVTVLKEVIDGPRNFPKGTTGNIVAVDHTTATYSVVFEGKDTDPVEITFIAAAKLFETCLPV